MKTAEKNMTAGWNDGQIQSWHDAVVAKGKARDYADIISKVTALPANTHTVETYATMSDGNPAFRITVGDVNNGKPNILLLGGVHGYEPSGVTTSLEFAKERAPSLTKEFNFVIYPCISPWAYEYDQRWNAKAQDPNRLFTRAEGFAQIEECQHFMTSMENHGTEFLLAMDLHETPDSDIEYRQLRAERFGSALSPDYKLIPQGFYLLLTQRESAGENAQQLLFGQSVIDKVRKVSPIAPEAKVDGKVNFGGVILAPSSEGLTRHYLATHAKQVAVTEVYPDHEKMDPQKAVQAHLAAIDGGLDHVRGHNL